MLLQPAAFERLVVIPMPAEVFNTNTLPNGCAEVMLAHGLRIGLALGHLMVTKDV